MSRQNQTDRFINSLGVFQVGRNLGGGALIPKPGPMSDQIDGIVDDLRNVPTVPGQPNTASLEQKGSGILNAGDRILAPGEDDSGDAKDGGKSLTNKSEAKQRSARRSRLGTLFGRMDDSDDERFDFGEPDENYGKGPSGVNYMKPLDTDEAKQRQQDMEFLSAERRYPMDIQRVRDKVMADAKAQAKKYGQAGPPEEASDADDQRSAGELAEDQTAPASREQQPELGEDGEVLYGANDLDQHGFAKTSVPSIWDPKTGTYISFEDWSRANTNPIEVTPGYRQDSPLRRGGRSGS